MSAPEAAGAALLRVVLGAVFVMHGAYAFTVLGPAGVAALVMRLAYPAGLAGLLAWYLILAHAAGGALLVVGLWTRWAALAQVPIMASAVFLLHLPEGFFMRGIIVDPAAGRAIAAGWEHSLLVLAATLAVALLGAGAWSVDRARATRRRPHLP
ncbi:MAG: hypothetical protein A3E31_10985 [Candidatus Rokubacteria bacterium RIFCSPHIGHO2_12_FULL_73_22]|nr:MAG: hypothetical protein A3D33_04670 [Candidatus Rokubacteria bacterium RIFCSPHIGHO2_02_FULL_73_26]OGL00786.1 MAG: hypothetical protein A3E31_10985 [Candidatus Rokubacteria bacterium RIFCSPHIGHO2_12_FULL_73_22]OGL12467.1 MAG: hypothetical protein A3I14_11580 [Candidatus Rokubacteria bacterium RIFCSPLOWO2_02_FULL_73_56]OGL29657.1 MAG: hypothetical protein A3G44_13745 [Candidatus Rokubacteria bacterium RIFCSPLOWO2_12_FULL_73_47]